MSLKSFSVFCFLATMFSVHAQTFTPVKDVDAIQKKVTDATLKLNTIQCDFTQEKNMSMLTNKAISKGKFYFEKESKVRLDYLQPDKNLIIMNNGKMLIKDDKKTSQMDMHRSKVFQQLNNIIVGSINGSLFTSKDFVVSFYETNTLVKAELKPVSKVLKNFLSSIVIILTKKDFTAVKLVMNETSGDNTTLSFSNKEINEKLDNSLFAVK